MRITEQLQMDYVAVNSAVLSDTSLSWKAKGLFIYLWEQDDEQELCETEIVKRSTNGLSSIRSGLKELEQQGYLKRQRVRNEQGKFKEKEWILFETPQKMQNGTL